MTLVAGTVYAESAVVTTSKLQIVLSLAARPSREERPLAAEELVVAALADSAEDPELLILLGKSRRARNDLAGAIECYRKAQVLSEKLAEASLELAELYGQFGMSERAAQELERAAVLLSPDNSLSRAVEAAAQHLQRE